MNQKDTITHIIANIFTFVVGTLNPLCNILDKITESRLFSTSASSNKTQINVMCKTLYILFQCKTSRKSNNEDFESSLNIYQNGKVKSCVKFLVITLLSIVLHFHSLLLSYFQIRIIY